LSAFSAVKWIQRGGDKKRIRYTSLPISTNEDTGATLTLLLGLKGKLVFGMHQRADNSIFSPIPLLAYSKIESATTTFLLLGGGDAYKQQAKELGLKNVHFLEATGDSSFIFKFLRTLSVYAHGRKDGEINSQAIAEAMYVGLPIVSHFSEINNGHVECIGDAGKVVSTVDEYQEELYKLLSNSKYLSFRKKNSLQIFKDNYEFSGQIKKYVGIYEDVYNNPYPNSLRRFATSLHYTQNIRVVLFYIYLKIKYALLKKS
jgi:hypothetical protein